MRELVIATRNKKKLKELKKYLKGLKVKLICLVDIENAPRIKEDGATFRDNAIKKALTISKFTGGPVLADDSGLVVDTLHGKPGVRSSRFAGENANDHDNNMKLLRCLEGIPFRKRRARFVCDVAIADSDKIVKTIEEDCSGIIGFDIRGRYGFGYDPLFVIPRYNKTFGQLGPKVKDRMSHRAKALRKAVEFLKRYM